jgi:hypothetical protein
MASRTDSRWHVELLAAKLGMPRLVATLDLERPERGLQALAVDGDSLGDVQLLAVQLSPVLPATGQSTVRPTIVDTFARGDDMAVTYAERPQPAMQTQVYWRAHNASGAIAAVELLVSVQTGLLDSCPHLSTNSRLAATEVLPLENVEAQGATLFRLTGGQLSYAEVAHPTSDCVSEVRTSSLSQSQAGISHRLFQDRLEKGVILRARVLGVLVDRADDQRQAARLLADFLRTLAPLTT